MVNLLRLVNFLFFKGSLALAMTTSSKPHVMCFGLSSIDFVATVDHFPEPDEKMRSSSLIIEGGGNAANTACAMGRLSKFIDVTLVTGIGEDANGKNIVESIENHGVKVLAERFPGNSPFSYILNTDFQGDNTRTIVHQPASGDISMRFVEDLSLDDVSAAHFDCRYPHAAVAMAKRCVDAGIPYSVDVERPRDGLLEILQGASVVICSSNYCSTVLGKPPPVNTNDHGYHEFANHLRTVVGEQAPNAIIAVVTLGSKGSCLITLHETMVDKQNVTSYIDDANAPVVTLRHHCLHCSPFPNIEVVDSTGAGDAFIGGFLTTLWAYTQRHQKVQNGNSRKRPSTDLQGLTSALRVASFVAARKIRQPGARKGLPLSDDSFISSEFGSLHFTT